MTDIKLNTSDLGLIYLSNFDNGLSYYKWDQDVINYLKSRIHPNEILNDLNSQGLINSIDSAGVKTFILSEKGRLFVTDLIEKLKPVFFFIQEIQEKLIKQGFEIERIDLKKPVSTFSVKGNRYKMILGSENLLRVFLPSDTPKAYNEIEITMESLLNTTFLEQVLVANFLMFEELEKSNTKPIA